jgi:hypothetical protein
MNGRRLISLPVLVVVIGLALLVGTAKALDLVPYQASGWKYLQVQHNDPLNQTFMGAFDDSGWNIGQGAFGSEEIGECSLGGTLHTPWSSNTNMLLRRTFTADITQPITVYIGIDNDATVYVNGAPVLTVGHNGCPQLDNFSALVPPVFLQPNENVLAVRAVDNGDVSYVDVRLEGTPGGGGNAEFVQTDCEVLSVTPPRTRLGMALINLGQTPICGFRLTPTTSDPNQGCQLIECAAPPGWACSVDAAAGSGTWTTTGACLAPSDILRGFTFVLDPPYCCYSSQFMDAQGYVVFTNTTCFACDATVPVRPSSWAQVKQLYR